MWRPSAARAEAGGVGVGVRHRTVCRHQRVIWITGPVTDTNHSLLPALAQDPCISVENWSRRNQLAIHYFTSNLGGPCRGYSSYFEQGAQTICLRCIALDPKERQNWPRQRATKTGLIETLQFGSYMALCNEVTPPFNPSICSKCKKRVTLSDRHHLPASFHPGIVLTL